MQRHTEELRKQKEQHEAEVQELRKQREDEIQAQAARQQQTVQRHHEELKKQKEKHKEDAKYIQDLQQEYDNNQDLSNASQKIDDLGKENPLVTPSEVASVQANKTAEKAIDPVESQRSSVKSKGDVENTHPNIKTGNAEEINLNNDNSVAPIGELSVEEEFNNAEKIKINDDVQQTRSTLNQLSTVAWKSPYNTFNEQDRAPVIGFPFSNSKELAKDFSLSVA